MNNQTEKYRFDDSYSKVYELIDNDYVYFCNYFSAGIETSDTDIQKIEKANEVMCERAFGF